NVSTICFLPSGIINIIVVEFINSYTEYSISYGMWFLLMLPIWIILLPSIYFSIISMVKVKNYPSSILKKNINKLKTDLPLISFSEKTCIAILVLVVFLWGTQGWHDIHPAFIAILGVIIMGIPKFEIISWNRIIQ